MEAVIKRPLDGFRRFAGTRRGALTVAAVAAVLAAALLVAYLKHYKSSVRLGATPARVLVADRLIPKGTAGDQVATAGFFRPTTLAQDEVQSHALPDAAALSGKVATRDIYPGEQLVAADFSAKGDPIRGKLAGDERAIGVSLEQAPGLIGTIHPGDHVDVDGIWDLQAGSAASAILRTIVQDALVLKAPTSVSRAVAAQQNDPIIVRVTDVQAAEIALASENGHVWLSLRPPVGARSSKPSQIDTNLFGVGR